MQEGQAQPAKPTTKVVSPESMVYMASGSPMSTTPCTIGTQRRKATSPAPPKALRLPPLPPAPRARAAHFLRGGCRRRWLVGDRLQVLQLQLQLLHLQPGRARHVKKGGGAGLTVGREVR